MAKRINYHYVIVKGYIHKIPINTTTDNVESSLNKIDKQKQKTKKKEKNI
jgi:hypothetical protein